jgi:hypothetical protein
MLTREARCSRVCGLGEGDRKGERESEPHTKHKHVFAGEGGACSLPEAGGAVLGVATLVASDSQGARSAPRSSSSTRNPKPETRNPKPETRNLKPETRNSGSQVPNLNPKCPAPDPQT